MANSIDLATIAVGVALGYGLKDEIRCAGNICKSGLLAGLAASASAANAGAGAPTGAGAAPAGQGAPAAGGHA